jgi:4-hydroxy-tetrahydrodipicolinate synthase
MVPLDERGQINEAELRKLVDYLIDRGISGLYPNGSTGEFTRFSFEERKRIVEIVADQNRGRTPILAGAAEANIDMTLQACEHYGKLGCDAAAICGPYYYPLSQEGVYAYFAELARHSPIDITLYNIPQFSNEISVATVARLAAEFPKITGIKDSQRDLPRMLNTINQVQPIRPEFTFLIGCEEILVPFVIMGGHGGTVATSGVAPEAIMKMYNAAAEGRIEEARCIQYKMLDLINVLLLETSFPEGFRVGMELRGFQMGNGRQPLSEKESVDRVLVREKLSALLSESGFTGDLDACGTTPMPQTDQVQRIVSSVMTRLRQQGVQ